MRAYMVKGGGSVFVCGECVRGKRGVPKSVDLNRPVDDPPKSGKFDKCSVCGARHVVRGTALYQPHYVRGG